MKTLRWTWPILGLTLLILIPWALYEMRPVRPIALCVLDKTVPFRNWYEHRSLFWLLRHLNVVKPEGTNYVLEADYLGAYPPPIPGDPPEQSSVFVAPRRG